MHELNGLWSLISVRGSLGTTLVVLLCAQFLMCLLCAYWSVLLCDRAHAQRNNSAWICRNVLCLRSMCQRCEPNQNVTLLELCQQICGTGPVNMTNIALAIWWRVYPRSLCRIMLQYICGVFFLFFLSSPRFWEVCNFVLHQRIWICWMEVDLYVRHASKTGLMHSLMESK